MQILRICMIIAGSMAIVFGIVGLCLSYSASGPGVFSWLGFGSGLLIGILCLVYLLRRMQTDR